MHHVIEQTRLQTGYISKKSLAQKRPASLQALILLVGLTGLEPVTKGL